MTEPLPPGIASPEIAGPEILGHENAYQGFFRIDHYRLRHGLFGGGMSAEISREVFERGHAAAILLYDPELDAVVLIEQFRLPAYLAGFGASQIEIPAGMIESGETPEEVAHREVWEETGLILLDLLPVRRFLSSPGGSTETVHMFCGRVDSSKAGGIHGDATEDIRVFALPYADAAALMEDGTIANAFTLLALQWLGANRCELRRRWGTASP